MNLRGICWVVLFSMFLGVGQAQHIEEIQNFRGAEDSSQSRCPEDAGVVDLINFDGQSNSHVFPGPIYLCFQDQFTIEQQGPFDVTCNDPDPFTIPGVGYAFYKCQPNPAVTGPSEANVLADNCLEDDPPNFSGPWWSYSDKINGDALFFNEGQVQDFFNGGDPEEMWFAPFTLDDFAGRIAIESGGQINVRPDQFFHVIYLNEVQITNKMIGVGGNPLAGSFQIVGGVAEWDFLNGSPSDYSDIGIYKVGDITVRGTIQGSNFTHNDVVNFTVPEEGEYIIYVEDEKSCGAAMEANFTDNDGSVTFNIGSFTDVQGGSQCVSFCVEDFQDINAMQFTISFDPRFLTYNSLQNLNLFALSDGNFELSSAENGVIRLVWIDPESFGKTVADGDCIFDVCFDVNDDAPIGSCSGIAITGNVIPISVEQQDPEDITNTFSLDVIQNPGMACIDPGNDLTAAISTCNSASGSFSGSVTFSIYGGNGPYSYNLLGTISPTNGSNIMAGDPVFIGNLVGGTYQLMITDAGGTSINRTVMIGNGNPLTIDLTGIDPSCFNFSNGEIQATVSGGVELPMGGYSYEWSNLIFNDDNIDRLTQGNYSVTVTDANGCTAVGNEFIGTDPINVVVDVTTMPTCLESTNGVVTATVTGGTPSGSGEYNIKWSGDVMATSFDQGDVVTNNQVQGGMITVEVTDFKGCKWSEFFDIEAQKELDLRFDFDQNILCAGDSEARFRVFGEYADGSDFSLDAANSPVLPNGTTKINGPDHVFFPSLGAGSYQLTITDDVTGCSIDTAFILQEPELLVVNAAANYSCTSTTGGSISLETSGGTPGYTYLWDDGITDEDRTNLDEGEYSVTVTDMNGCVDSSRFELVRSPSATIEGIIVENIGCAGNTTGSLEAIVNTIGGSVTYNWEGPGGPYTTSKITDLGPGIYMLTITDNMGCIDTEEREILEGVDFTYEVNSITPTCTNSPDGSLAISVNDPGDYVYVWDHPNDNGTEVLSNIPAGDYFVTVTQIGGCAQIDTLTLDAPVGIDIAIENIAPTSCSYSIDGSVTVTASGGVVNNGNYGFIWSSGEEDPFSNNNTSTANMLGSGEQYVVVVDEMCFDTLFFTIEAPDSLMLDADNTMQTNITCFGFDDGTATLAAVGGTPSYLYFWPDNDVDDASITDLTPGFHRYVLADGNGCITLDSLEIFEPDSLIVMIDPVNTIPLGCSNDEDGVIAVTVTGGDITNGYTYAWTSNVSTTNTANGLGPGEYMITVTDDNGCIDSVDYIIMAPEPISADIPTPAAPVCFGDRTCIEIEDVFGGSGSGYRFSINNGPLNSIDSCIAVFAGVYDLAIFDNTGCSFDTTLTIEQPEELILNLGPDIEVDLGDSSTVIDIAIDGPNPIESILWEPNSDFGCLNDDCSRIAIFPNVTTLYKVNVQDDEGCTAEDELLVEVIKVIRAYFPNAFSPNGDGFNDIFNAFTGRGIQSIDEFAIFDRWGNQMYGIRNLSPNSGGTEGWDGRLNGTEVQAGVYSYYARVTLIDNEQVLLRGDVTLIR